MGEVAAELTPVGVVLAGRDFLQNPSKLALAGLLPGFPRAGLIDNAGGLVIGKLDDVGSSGLWKSGDHTLNLPPIKNGTAAQYWKQNSTELRNQMRNNKPIRDVSPDKGGGFLEAERNVLRNKGWTFDGTNWNPPA